MTSKYVTELLKGKQKKLLEAMRLKSTEDVVAGTEITTANGKLYVSHGRDKDGNCVESIYSDFLIIKIYNSVPSEYDQDRYQNIMIELCGEEYRKDVKRFNKTERNNHDNDFRDGDFEEEEYEDQ